MRAELKAGDRVLVVRRATWGGWFHCMDYLVGKEFVVEDVTPGLYDDFARVDGYHVPMYCLEKVGGNEPLRGFDGESSTDRPL